MPLLHFAKKILLNMTLVKPRGVVMFQLIKQKYQKYKDKKAIQRLPWFAKKAYSLDRKRKIGERLLLSYDYGNRRIDK
jgi:hypothetical protein